MKLTEASLLIGDQPKRMRAESYLDPEVFRSLLTPRGETGCLEWSRTRIGGTHNYGCFPKNKKTYLAHRQAWEFAHGPIPAGLGICHTCDNPPCCNPDHMFLGTQAENVKDMQQKGRARGGAHGEDHGGAKLSDDQVREIRNAYEKGAAPHKTRNSASSLAGRYGLSKSTVLRIVHRKLWAHVV